jgi:hypothetical protein
MINPDLVLVQVLLVLILLAVSRVARWCALVGLVAAAFWWLA